MFKIPEPFQFNPLKHHLSFIREFVSSRLAEMDNLNTEDIIIELKRIGNSVMDVYTGSLSVEYIVLEVNDFLRSKKLNKKMIFSEWVGQDISRYRIITLSDTSEWMLKFHNDEKRYVHLFPCRLSPHSYRIKANTLKSAILYHILIGKDFITGDDLNRARALLGLSPVKDTAETEAITEMIEILRA